MKKYFLVFGSIVLLSLGVQLNAYADNALEVNTNSEENLTLSSTENSNQRNLNTTTNSNTTTIDNLKSSSLDQSNQNQTDNIASDQVDANSNTDLSFTTLSASNTNNTYSEYGYNPLKGDT